MKKRFLFVLALLSVLTVSGCDAKQLSSGGKLSIPQELMVESDGDRSLIIFDEVPNAQYYNIYINDVCVTVQSSGTGTIEFDASKIITLPQKYVIKVKAGGDNYFESQFTESIEYNHTSVLEAPVISIDGTTLNWNKIANAEFYDVSVTTYNPTIETVHRFVNNKFDFKNILANKGEYLFKVRAISESDEYISSVDSNQVRYTYKQTLVTPNNLKAEYDAGAGEVLLTFVSGISEDVDGFTVKIDGVNYDLTKDKFSKFLYSSSISNLYHIKLETFAKDKGISIDNSTMLNVSVKANSLNAYLQSSEFSNSIACQFKSVLKVPTLTLEKSNDSCTIKINPNNNSKFLSGFAIYLNGVKYKTIKSSITEVELPLSVVGDAGIRVQALSNNSNCFASNLSDAVYVVENNALQKVSATYNEGKITWDNVSGATEYYVELLNDITRYNQVGTSTEFDMTMYPAGEYWLRIIAMAEGYKQSEFLANIEHVVNLQVPQDIRINSDLETTSLQFEEVEGAYGYLLYLNDIKINHLFTSSPINLSQYLSEGSGYKIQIQAVGSSNQYVNASEISDYANIERVKTLSAPLLTIVKEDQRYYLNVYVDESEEEMADSYEIWINYQSIGIEPFKDAKIDITSYFANAGQYNFMVKANAIDSPYVKDSNMATLTYNCIKQLDVVTDILVTKLESESKYILTFKEQTLAAKYRIQIVKGDDDDYSVEFETNQSVIDISSHLVENGVYRVYVQALATEGSFYTDSPASGNPYRVTKGHTLPSPQNIEINKSSTDNKIILSWDSVENSSGYQVYIYYQNELKKSILVPQSTNPNVDVGSGENLTLIKEGNYSIQIKSLGDDKSFENSQISSSVPYNYAMESVFDFIRNNVFIAGNTYSYRIENAEQLKLLLWYHYLYNEDVWDYNTLEYNLKIYCSKNLDDLASSISESLATQVASVEANVDKMTLIAKALLSQYPDVHKYIEGCPTQSFCLTEEKSVYIFRYQNDLDKDKTKTLETSNQVYNDKVDLVDAFDQRNATYVFAIDTQTSVDVTTTEQLFMALQYNKKPNFVGDCKVAKAVYENARFILRQICSDNMSEYQKTLQIYDLLTKRVAWNNVTLGGFDEMVTASDSSSTLRANLKDLYLESVLYNFNSDNGLYSSIDEIVGTTADSEGLSKVFVALCSIEGIDSIKVQGKKIVDVAGSSKEISYSWNKVYIDIEEDGIEGKRWYVVDLTGAIKNSIDIRKGGVSISYQVATHNYFLLDDASFKMQATSLHKRLGDTTDYVANTTFNYYASNTYHCEYGSNEVSGTFQAKTNEDIKNILLYASLKANKRNRVIIDIDANIDSAEITDKFISNITNGATDANSINQVRTLIMTKIYEDVQDVLTENGLSSYACNLNVSIVDGRYIVLVLEAQGYGK